jgi:hypothetical protein
MKDSEEDEEVRQCAIEALGAIRDKGAVEELLSALKDPRYWIRRKAIDALGEICDERAIPVLAELLQVTDLAEHLVIPLVKLGEQHPTTVVRFVSTKLEPTESVTTRSCAAEILIVLGDTGVRGYLPSIILDMIASVPGAYTGYVGYEEGNSEAPEAKRRLGLEVMASRAGMDSALLELAKDALGHSWNSDRSVGRDFEYYHVEGIRYQGGMSEIEQLCLRRDLWSSAILYRVAKKKDAQVITGYSDWDKEPFITVLSFEKERLVAQSELSRRGWADSDPALNLKREIEGLALDCTPRVRHAN